MVRVTQQVVRVERLSVGEVWQIGCKRIGLI
jgi:hypothetical protein